MRGATGGTYFFSLVAVAILSFESNAYYYELLTAGKRVLNALSSTGESILSLLEHGLGVLRGGIGSATS